MKISLLNDTKLLKIFAMYVQCSTNVHLKLLITFINFQVASFLFHTFARASYYANYLVLRPSSIKILVNSSKLPFTTFSLNQSITSIPVSHRLDSVHSLRTARFCMSQTLCKKPGSRIIDSSSSPAMTRERALGVSWTVLVIMFTSLLK